MRSRYSFILPIAAILSGIVLELNTLGIAGNFLPNDIFVKIWPALLVFAGLDLLFTQRRLIGALVVLFTAAAILSTQFMTGGTANPIWQFFIKIWPILLILFGFDWIFSGKSFINTAVIIAIVIIIIYVLFAILELPVPKSLPFNLDLKSIIPTSVFSGQMPVPQQQEPWENSPNAPTQPVPETGGPIAVSGDGQVYIAIPPQSQTTLDLNAASGKVSLKAGAGSSQFAIGSIQLDPAETLTQNINLEGAAAQYIMQSSGAAAAPDRSNWDLSLTSERTLSINAVMNNGYIKADLRTLNLSSVNIENKFGPIDIMMPQNTGARIKISAFNGDIRIYVPRGAGINCYISGTGAVDFPQYSYTWSDNVLRPTRPSPNMINVEVTSNNGSVRIIESE